MFYYEREVWINLENKELFFQLMMSVCFYVPVIAICFLFFCYYHVNAIQMKTNKFLMFEDLWNTCRSKSTYPSKIIYHIYLLTSNLHVYMYFPISNTCSNNWALLSSSMLNCMVNHTYMPLISPVFVIIGIKHISSWWNQHKSSLSLKKEISTGAS